MPSSKLSRSPTPADPNPIPWQKVQFPGPPLLGLCTPMGCFPLHSPPNPGSVCPFNIHKPCCAQHIGGFPLHSQPPALAAFSRLRSTSPQSNEGAPQSLSALLRHRAGRRHSWGPPCPWGALCGPHSGRRPLPTAAGGDRLLSPPACILSYSPGEKGPRQWGQAFCSPRFYS